MYKKVNPHFIKSENISGSLNLELSLLIGLVSLASIAVMFIFGGEISYFYKVSNAKIQYGSTVGNIDLSVVDTEKNPVEDVKISIGTDRVVTGTTDSNGSVSLENVNAGNTFLTAETPDGLKRKFDIFIPEFETLELELELYKFVKFSYNLNGVYEENPTVLEVEPGSTVTIPASIPSADNSPFFTTFKYWNTQKNGMGITKFPGDSMVLGTENTTLFAQWNLDNRDWFVRNNTELNKGSNTGDSEINTIQASGWDGIGFAIELYKTNVNTGIRTKIFEDVQWWIGYGPIQGGHIWGWQDEEYFNVTVPNDLNINHDEKLSVKIIFPDMSYLSYYMDDYSSSQSLERDLYPRVDFKVNEGTHRFTFTDFFISNNTRDENNNIMGSDVDCLLILKVGADNIKISNSFLSAR